MTILLFTDQFEIMVVISKDVVEKTYGKNAELYWTNKGLSHLKLSIPLYTCLHIVYMQMKVNYKEK